MNLVAIPGMRIVFCIAIVFAAQITLAENAAVRDPTAPVSPSVGVAEQGDSSRVGQMLQMLGSGTSDIRSVTSGIQAVTRQSPSSGDDQQDEELQERTAGLRMVIVSKGGGSANAEYAAAFFDSVWYRVGSGTRSRLLVEVTSHGARFQSEGPPTYLQVVEHGVRKSRHLPDNHIEKDIQ